MSYSIFATMLSLSMSVLVFFFTRLFCFLPLFGFDNLVKYQMTSELMKSAANTERKMMPHTLPTPMAAGSLSDNVHPDE